MTRKKNTAYKLMKKTSEAETALVRSIKNEVEMRAVQKDINNTSLEYKLLENEEKEIESRKEKLKSLKSAQDEIRKEVIKITGVNKFSMPRNKTEIIATMDNLTFTCFTLHNLNGKIKERESISRNRLNHSHDSFYRLNFSNAVTKDILHLLQPPGKLKSKPREQLEDRRNYLKQEIRSLIEVVDKKMKLNEERQTSVDSNEKTLEKYLNVKINDIKSEIYKYSDEIKILNSEIKNIAIIIDEKKNEISNTKKVMKEIPKKDIKSSIQYQQLIVQNTEFQKELDAYLSQSDKLRKEFVMLMIELERQLKKEMKNSETANEIQQLLLEEKKKIDDRKARAKLQQKTYEQMVTEIEKSESQLKDMSFETKRLEEECQLELNRLSELKSKTSEVENENEVLLKIISRMSQVTLEKLWYK